MHDSWENTGGQSVNVGMLSNPSAIQHLIQNDKAYKFMKLIQELLIIGCTNSVME